METSTTGKVAFAGLVVVAGLSIVFGVLMLRGLASGGWSVQDGGDVLLLIAVIAGLAGSVAALVGAYVLRRAQTSNRSQATGYVLLVAGTLGIALLGGVTYWTIVGPIVAVGIIIYWLIRLNAWRRERTAAV